MESTKKLGKKGEEFALIYLLDRGYEILEVNWQKQHLEIDLIAQKDDILVFVEVKSRSSEEYGQPESFVDPKKQKHLFRAANLYYEHSGSRLEARFDIISVLFLKNNAYKIEHLPDAFYPIA